MGTRNRAGENKSLRPGRKGWSIAAAMKNTGLKFSALPFISDKCSKPPVKPISLEIGLWPGAAA